MLRYMVRSRGSLYGFCTLSNKNYRIASKMGGESKDNLYDLYAGKFQNHDLQQMKKTIQKKNLLKGVNIISTEQECKKCVDILMNSDAIAAWDTQTMDLDIKQQAPVGKGKIICASFFAGPQLNFGRGPRVFIDNFGKNAGLLNHFKPYLQSEKHKKIWHNYGFDRHVFYNHGIDVKGFGGDTMHMARLQDSSKQFGKYSLAELTSQHSEKINKASTTLIQKKLNKLKIEITKLQAKNKDAEEFKTRKLNYQRYLSEFQKELQIKKKKMQQLFGRRKQLKNGSSGVSYQYPTTLTLHTNQQYLLNWIKYSVLDSQCTYFLYIVLRSMLLSEKIIIDNFPQQKQEQEQKQKKPKKQKKQKQEEKIKIQNMLNFYQKYWLPFGQVLTQLERQGIQIDVQHMEVIEKKAKADLRQKKDKFLNFLKKYQQGKNIDHFNPSSTFQLQQLLFAPCQIKTQQQKKNQNQSQKLKSMSPQDKKLHQNCPVDKENSFDPKKVNRKAVELNQLVKQFKVENMHNLNNTMKFVKMEVTGYGLKYHLTTPTGLPAADLSVLDELAGHPQKGEYGRAYHQLKQRDEDEEFSKQFCVALRSLIDYSMKQTLLNTFIEPLRGYVDHNHRVHCSLNINTETGRLSARKPNLQNQPALDKDVYKIRKAFIAGKGKKLIVADYGQLELRVLAHLTNCKAMIEAFQEGGDFHSRTAIGMYDYIKKDLEEGKILLEWDRSKGDPPVPLLKEKYAAQRKKAKTVNFSIAYGKSAKGFADDWKCSLEEAKKIIQAWFKERVQVQQWQKKKKIEAKKTMQTETLLGRVRNLKNFFNKNNNIYSSKLEGMGNRRAINTPIQGGAADIVNASMVKIARNQKLKEMGWKLLMQIHDQLILQGPQYSADQALKIVKHDMQNPFDFKLRVDLQVDAKIGDNWYQCK